MALYPASLSGKVFWLQPSSLTAIGTRMSVWPDTMGVTGGLGVGTSPIVEAGPDSTRSAMRFDTGFFTYNLDLRTATSGSEIWLLIKGVAGANGAYKFGSSGSTCHYPFSDGNIYDDTASNTRPGFAHGGAAIVWNPVRIVQSGTGLDYYINNVSKRSVTTGYAPSLYSSFISIGGNVATQSTGWLAEVVIFNRLLTAPEATAMWSYLGNPLDVWSDTFAGAGPIGPATYITNNSAAGTEASEPLSNAPQARTLWASFTPPASGTYQIDTIGSAIDSALAVYTGSALGSLTLVGSDDSSGGSGNAKLTLHLTAGITYQLQLGSGAGAGGAGGALTLTIAALSYDATLAPDPVLAATSVMNAGLLKGRTSAAADALTGG